MRIDATVRVKMNKAGRAAIMRSPAVKADLERRAGAIADQAGSGHFVDSALWPLRARAAVVTRTVGAKAAEANDRNLTRAIDAGKR